MRCERCPNNRTNDLESYIPVNITDLVSWLSTVDTSFNSKQI